jgi:hypothetical protein
MSTTAMHPLAEDYVRRLDRAARRLPRGERRELLDEIRTHLYEAIEPGMSDAEALTVLDRLGDPEDIVEAQLPEVRAVDGRRGTHEWAAIMLLLFGGFIFGVGWIVGLVLLWSSRTWTAVDKLIGTLVIPGGLAGTVLVLGFAVAGVSQTCGSAGTGPVHCTGGPSTAGGILVIALLAFCVLGPICTSVYLARRAR